MLKYLPIIQSGSASDGAQETDNFFSLKTPWQLINYNIWQGIIFCETQWKRARCPLQNPHLVEFLESNYI